VGGSAGLAMTMAQRLFVSHRSEPEVQELASALGAVVPGGTTGPLDLGAVTEVPAEPETSTTVAAPSTTEATSTAMPATAQPARAEGGVGALTGSAATSAVDSYSQFGELIEVLEERILAEIERRGGRFAGVF